MKPRKPQVGLLKKLIPEHKILPPLEAKAAEERARSILQTTDYERARGAVLKKREALARKKTPLTLTIAFEETLRATSTPLQALSALRSLVVAGDIVEAPKPRTQNPQLNFEHKLQHPLSAKLENEYFRLSEILNPQSHPELVGAVMQHAIQQVARQLK